MQVEPEEAAPTPSGAATAAVAPSAPTPPAAAAAGPSGRCFYTRLPGRLLKQRGLTAAELTAANLDKSAALLAAVGQRYGSGGGMSPSCMEGLLGELQFAFAAFVFGQSLDGFSQVKEDAVFENQHFKVWGWLCPFSLSTPLSLLPSSAPCAPPAVEVNYDVDARL